MRMSDAGWWQSYQPRRNGSCEGESEACLSKEQVAKLTKDKSVGVIKVSDVIGIVVDDLLPCVQAIGIHPLPTRPTGPGSICRGSPDTRAVFEPPTELEGEYEVRFAYAYGGNRPSRCQSKFGMLTVRE